MNNSTPAMIRYLAVSLSLAGAVWLHAAPPPPPQVPPDPGAVAPAEKSLKGDWLASLTGRSTPSVYRGEDLKRIGMPVGGFFAGQLYLGGDGRLWHWDIFNDAITTGSEHYANPMEQTFPLQQGFAVRVTQDGKSGVRTLDAAGFPDVTFTGRYPIGQVHYADAKLPVTVNLEAFSPFTPLKVEESSYPATIFRFTLKNVSTEPAEIQLGGWLENKVCARTGQRSLGVRQNRVTRGDSLLMLECSARPVTPEPKTDPRPTILFADFEGNTFSGWTVEGTAFGNGPTKGAPDPEQKLRGFSGKALANSYASGSDASTGKLISRPFTIDRRFINFLIGGGNHPGQTCINLLVDSKVVRSATGENHDVMGLTSWDVGDLQGRTATIELVDEVTGGWGHIEVDHVEFADVSATLPARLAESADFGTMTLALLDASVGDTATTGLNGEPANTIFAAGSDAPCEQPFSNKLVGSLARSITLASGESKTVSFVLTWHFPNLSVPITWIAGRKPMSERPNLLGRHYAMRFDSAAAVARMIARDYPRLYAQTRLWCDTWYDSTLPHWLLDRTLANISTLATSTSYRFADGLYWAWEGVGNCPGTCNHVYGYEQAIGRLFPELDRLRLEMADFNPDVAFNEKTGAIGHRIKVTGAPVFDGQAMTLLRVYRDHQMSADDTFLRRQWPKIKLAIQWFIRQDTKQEGVIWGPQANTLDGTWYGMVPWLSSLYIATLRAGEKMAGEMGDAEFAAQCRTLAEAGMKNFAPRMFNGEYFEQIPDPKKLEHVGSYDGCEIDQVLGQQWAFQVGLGRILPEKETKQALESIWRYNFFPDVGSFRKSHPAGRWYAMPGEAGTVMCSWPKGEGMRVTKGFDYYFNECMNGFEHQVAAHMLWEGMVQQGLAVERAVHDRYSASRRNPYNEVECGDHYGRSMASYGVFTAVCGFEYDGPAAHIAFAPRIHPEDFKAAFTAAEGWGTYSQKQTGKEMSASITLKYGRLALKTLGLVPPAGATPKAVKVTLGGQPVLAKLQLQPGQAQVVFDQRLTLTAGQSLVVNVATAIAPIAEGDGSIVVPSGSTDAVVQYETAGGKLETKAEHDARMAWWREARYGLFIHWSLSSVYAGEWEGKPSGGDWIMERVKASVAEYAEAAGRFTAEKFNAAEWVALAKAGGMKYIVITAKHHDGFTMFASKASTFNIRDATPFKRDPMAELAAACRREGLKFGLYYSQAQDWHHAGGYKPTMKWGPNQIGCEPGVAWDPAQDGDPDAYVKNIAAVHIREIVENYQPDIFWWDYPTQMPEESVKALRAPLANLPNVIVNNRLGNGVKGDFSTFEFDIPEEKTIGRDWETCTTMNKSWGYRRADHDYRPVSDLLREFIEIMSRGGNYLLNIGPDSTGKIPEPQIERITEIGKWMKQNAEFVCGTTAVKIGWQPKNQWLVSKDGVYYLHVTGWGKREARFPGLKTGIVSATTITGESLAIGKDGEGTTTIAPPANPDPLGTIVVLKFDGPVETKPARAECSPREDGSIFLPVKDAALPAKMGVAGMVAGLVFRGWADTSQIPSWKLLVPTEGAGDYKVKLVYSCEDIEAGSTFELVVGDSKVSGVVQSTGSKFIRGQNEPMKHVELTGMLHLQPGPQTLSMVPKTVTGQINRSVSKNAVMTLRDITLTPVNKSQSKAHD